MKKLAIFCLCVVCIIVSTAGTVFAEDDDVDPYGEIYFKYDFQSEQYKYDRSLTLPYRIFIPRDYDETKSYPVILSLHGSGESGKNNESQLTNIIPYLFLNDNKEAFESIVIAPQCPEDNTWGNGGYSYETDMTKALAGLLKLVEGKYSVDKTRIYVIGISMGGNGVWDLLIRHNKMFAAGVSICGSGDCSKASVLKDTPVYVFHGANDNVIPVSNSREMVKAIEDAGGTYVKYVEYEDEGHAIWNIAMKTDGLLDWLFDQSLLDRYPDILSETEEIKEVKTSYGEPEMKIILPVAAAAGAAVIIVTVIILSRKKADKSEK